METEEDLTARIVATCEDILIEVSGHHFEQLL
jgi:hypothetical protein